MRMDGSICKPASGARSDDPLWAAAVAELPLRPSSAGVAVYPPGATWGPRTLTDFEFVWIIEGHCTWTANGEEFSAPPGTVILARPGIRETYRWDPSRQTRHAFVHFMVPLDGLPDTNAWPLIRQMPDGDILRPLFRHLLWAHHQDDERGQVAVQVALRHMLVSFLSGILETASAGGTELPRAINTALGWVLRKWEEDPMASPKAEELAKVAGTSVRQLSRDFQDQFECSPMAALRLMRLDKGAFLLSESSLDVQEIAARVGFKNQFHFSRAFKLAFGRAPNEFRKDLLKGEDAPPTSVLRLRATTRRLLGEV